MSTTDRIRGVFERTLSLEGRTRDWEESTQILGGLAELDSLTVFSVIAALEEEFAFSFDDGDINAEVLATFGSLTDFIAQKSGASR